MTDVASRLLIPTRTEDEQQGNGEGDRPATQRNHDAIPRSVSMSARRKRRWLPGVRIEVSLPSASQRRIVSIETPAARAASPMGMSSSWLVSLPGMPHSLAYLWLV